MLIRKTFISIIVMAVFLFACKTGAHLQDNSKLPRVENVTFTHKSDTVAVYYDLLAESAQTQFDVNLLLAFGENNVYEIESAYTTGDIGKDVLPGKQKKITWNVLKEFPNGLEEQNIQFIVTAHKENNNKKWIYIAGGALLIGAGTAVGLLAGGSGMSGLPLPPTRPGGN